MEFFLRLTEESIATKNKPKWKFSKYANSIILAGIVILLLSKCRDPLYQNLRMLNYLNQVSCRI